MDSWVVGQIAFWYTVHEVNPATIIDSAIQLWLDLVTPGRGEAGSGFSGLFRRLRETSERTTSELDIRSNLRTWDSEHPEIHHELLVRYVVAAAVSVAATSFYNSLRRNGGASASQRPRY